MSLGHPHMAHSLASRRVIVYTSDNTPFLAGMDREGLTVSPSADILQVDAGPPQGI